MRSKDPKLLRVAQRLAALIDREDCALIGAMAAAAHGYARATTDLDFVTRIPLREVQKRLTAGGVRGSLHRGDSPDTDFDCVKGELDGIPFEVLPALVPIEWDQTMPVPLSRGEPLRVVNLPTLIHLKLRAGGPQDVLDVVMLLQKHPEARERANSLATAFGLATQLESFMANPRIRAKAPKRPNGPGRPRLR